MNTYPPIALLVLNYNGLELLKKYLPSVVRAASYYPGKARVMVIDNNSSDGSLGYINGSMPNVIKICRRDNAYLFAYNQAVKDLTEDVFVILNNDVQVDENFILPLVERHQKTPNVFGVMPLVDSPIPNEVYRNRCSGVWEHGKLQTGKWLNRPEPGPTLFAHGGACLIDKKKFVILDGFDTAYWPGYAEDEDISYRAWRRGWTILFEPTSKVIHQSGASFKKIIITRERDIIKNRNARLFIIKNIHDKAMFREFIGWEIIRIVIALLKLRTVDVMGLMNTIKLLPNIINSRNKNRNEAVISDKEVLAKLC